MRRSAVLSRLLTGMLIALVWPVVTEGAELHPADVPPGQVLPSSDLDLPLPNLPTLAGREQTTPAVQAIPTPSAFPMGLALLGMVFFARRWVLRGA